MPLIDITKMNAPRKPLEEGDVIGPSALYVFAPVGSMSMALYAALFFAALIPLIGFMNKHDQFVSSMSGGGWLTFLVCVVVWGALLMWCVRASKHARLRHFTIGNHEITVHGGFGRTETISATDVKNVHVVYSISVLAPRIRIFYNNGTSCWLDGRGLDDANVKRVTDYLTRAN